MNTKQDCFTKMQELVLPTTQTVYLEMSVVLQNWEQFSQLWCKNKLSPHPPLLPFPTAQLIWHQYVRELWDVRARDNGPIHDLSTFLVYISMEMRVCCVNVLTNEPRTGRQHLIVNSKASQVNILRVSFPLLCREELGRSICCGLLPFAGRMRATRS